LATFENLAKHGYVTGNRYQDWRSINGFYPIIRLLQLHHVSMNSGYAILLSLSEHEGQELVREADSLHVFWVSAKPWATQTIVENAFIQARATRPTARCKNRPTAGGRNTE
jgi:hypothetical protein